ncbi:anti-sigma factor domain-containing protein [Modestobacter sp. VKM Ac-2978]|uniref:anti-sigma factor domain-containing protein n=1 Tax=Modestobacter sp. VKM Ac-2978 TaxID=3004132 RepID=UPI0022AAB754|nr:anti-sigma factor [Modestobacter sp. VKM Ac-2978]MCZ2847691.1 anti-sigma factor [Modestobacter sp. VKM Ac-2978]
MTAPMGNRDDEHRSWEELAVGWALHALEPEDEDLFAAHLAGCDRCADTVAETAEVMAAMSSDLPPAEPSDALRDRLRAAVEETEQLPQTAPPARRREQPPAAPARPVGPAAPWGAGTGSTSARDLQLPLPTRVADPRPAWRRVLPTALVAAAVAAVLALGAWNVALTSARDEAVAAAAEQARMLDTLLEPGQATIAPLTEVDEEGGEDVATVVARDGRLQVLADGLPVNDPGDRTYVVWGLPNGSPVAIGTFDVVTSEMDLRTVGSSETGLDEYPAYAISIEPGRQAPSEPTDIVATGQVTS